MFSILLFFMHRIFSDSRYPLYAAAARNRNKHRYTTGRFISQPGMPPLPALPCVQPGTMRKITKASAAREAGRVMSPGSGAGGDAGGHERVLAVEEERVAGDGG